MKRWSMAFLLVFALVFSVATSFATENAVPEPLNGVRISIVTGSVNRTPLGKTAPETFTAPFQLFAGDVIKTLPDSKAELVYDDGTVMRMKPETEVEVRLTSLKIFKGQTWHKFTKRGTEFLIETPSLVAGIRGTIFDVDVREKGKSLLAVLEGKVGVKPTKPAKGEEAGEILITDGKVVSCEPGYAPGVSLLDGAKKTAEWRDGEWMTQGKVDQLFANWTLLKSQNDPEAGKAKKAFDNAQAWLTHLKDKAKAKKDKLLKKINPKTKN